MIKWQLRVPSFKKIQEWILKSERIQKWFLPCFTKQIMQSKIFRIMVCQRCVFEIQVHVSPLRGGSQSNIITEANSMIKWQLRVPSFKKLQDWILKSERIWKWFLPCFTKQIMQSKIFQSMVRQRNRRIHLVSSKETRSPFFQSFSLRNVPLGNVEGVNLFPGI